MVHLCNALTSPLRALPSSYSVHPLALSGWGVLSQSRKINMIKVTMISPFDFTGTITIGTSPTMPWSEGFGGYMLPVWYHYCRKAESGALQNLPLSWFGSATSPFVAFAATWKQLSEKSMAPPRCFPTMASSWACLKQWTSPWKFTSKYSSYSLSWHNLFDFFYFSFVSA